MKISILAIGKVRGGEAEWCDEYLKRMKGAMVVREFAVSSALPAAEAQRAEAELLLKAIPDRAHVVLFDERGKDMPSRDFAARIAAWQDHGVADLVFIIGGADGVTDKVRERADSTLCFGRATWPHRLVRVMVLEQLYRAQQIIAGHPYHRD